MFLCFAVCWHVFFPHCAPVPLLNVCAFCFYGDHSRERERKSACVCARSQLVVNLCRHILLCSSMCNDQSNLYVVMCLSACVCVRDVWVSGALVVRLH